MVFYIMNVETITDFEELIHLYNTYKRKTIFDFENKI